MTDRELLEMAALAVGINAEWKEYTNAPPTMVVRYDPPVDGITGHDWNPLIDDGDALRLAVACCIEIEFGADDCGSLTLARALHEDRIPDYALEQHASDPYAATRRAIVRAAAEIGRAMP